MISLFKADISSFWDQLEISILNVLGQIFIYLTLGWLGPVYLALITTTRKIFTVLTSIVYHGHQVDVWRGSGISLVILGIILELVYSIKQSYSKNKGPSDKVKDKAN